MKKLVEWFFLGFLSLLLKFRYRVIVKGRENLNPETLSKPGGVLFLPNHPAVLIDPLSVALSLWPKYPVRPMIVEYFYYTPIVHTVMRFVNALPVPNFDVGSNSFKRKRSEEVVQTVINDLKKGDNFLIYPSGRTKQTAEEIIGGASAVHRIINEAPEANVVLIRTKGLWGSMFSRAFTGTPPPFFPTLLRGIKYVLMNFIFFTPRREVIIEIVPAPADFPYNATRLELNKWLEDWYNQPDGLTKQEGAHPGDSLVLIPHTIWSKKVSEPWIKDANNQDFDMIAIPNEVQDKIVEEISRITQMKKENIRPDMSLDKDLGMDSLDVADLISFIQDYFEVKNVSPLEMTTVGKSMAIASGLIVCEETVKDTSIVNLEKWFKEVPHHKLEMPVGETLPEALLKTCDRYKKRVAAGDERSGILTYKDIKLRTILLAEYIKTLPGEYVGILLPSSVPAIVAIFATQLAGKIPLLINWTVGARHLEAVVKLSKVESVLSSWAFLDRLENVDLDGIEKKLVMLEDVRRKFSLFDKVKAFYLSLLSPKSILKHFNSDRFTSKSPAVLLFTSGTENLPKGVSLSHENILSNQKDILEIVDLYSDDVFLSMLPPFHAFGFTVSGLLPLLAGFKVFFSPDPTDGSKLAKQTNDYGITLLCGAPTFLKGIFKAGIRENFNSLRLCVTGAEKAPPELFRLADKFGKKDVILEGYGITECAPVLTANRPNKEHAGVGEPLPSVELLIVHPETNAVMPKGEQGHILARGPNIFEGYINPDIAPPFLNVAGKSWYKTGDLGYIDEKGRLIISGRQKRFVKIGGEMISLASIEDALLESAVSNKWPISEDKPSLAIVAKEELDAKTKIYLFTDFDTTLDEVNLTLREKGFSNIAKVSEIKKIKEIPIMGTGKIYYRLLESQYLQNQ